MITVNDKLHLFTKRIIGRRQEEYDAIVQQLEEKMIRELQERKYVLEQDRAKYENTLLKGIKAERNQRLSNARSEKKRRLLLKRKNMIETLLEGVKAYTEEFVNSEAYLPYFKNLLLKHLDLLHEFGDFDMFLNQKDYDALRETLSEFLKFHEVNCLSFSVSEEPIIGGAMLLKSDGSSRIDFTLDSVIEDNRTYMGQLIYTLLEEAGETDE